MIKFRFISPSGPDYAAERLLRWEVLRKPLGMPPGSEGLPEDEQSLHLVAHIGKKIVGCVCFFPESETDGRIFQMAVSEEYQGRGFGRKLLQALERSLMQKGVLNVYLFVRSESEGFYQRMGYCSEGDLIKRFGEMYRLMRKNLPQSPIAAEGRSA
jgi:ribosomal protein S18 acetylase RimI-like enzyme